MNRNCSSDCSTKHASLVLMPYRTLTYSEQRRVRFVLYESERCWCDGYCTMMCGADRSTATVAMMVNIVKMMRQNLSTTMAANFQSLMTSASSSAFFIRLVMNCSSRKMFCSSRCVPELGNAPDSSMVVARMNPEPRFVVTVALGPPAAPPVVTLRKSSSMSNTFARRLFDDLSFNSNSFIRLFMRIVLRVIFFPGRLIPRIHGNHCRNTDLICNVQQNHSFSTQRI